MHGPTHTFWANLTPFTLQVKQVPMFNGMQEEIVVRICYVLRPLNCMGGDFIFKENELGQEMYLIEKVGFGRLVALYMYCFSSTSYQIR
jgi:hypothetical protein